MTTQYDNYSYVSDSGLIVPDTATVQEQVIADFRKALGQDLDTTPETPEGRLIQLITDYRVNTLGINAYNANQINLRYATGRFLDALGSFFGISRISASSTRVLADIVGTAGTVIPAGSQAQTTAGDVFYAENNITIGANGSVSGYFLSLEKGAIPCEVNTLNKIVNAVLGWDTITNTASAIIGTERESDDDFRRRIINSRISGISLMSAIKSKLENIDNVLSLWAYDNYSNATITYQGISIAPHSIVVIIDGGNNEEIAQALYDVKTGGTGYTAINGQSETVGVIDGAFGASYNVTFNRPEDVNFAVAISVKNISYTGNDLESQIKQAVINWGEGLIAGVDGLKIGQNISPFEISAAVSSVIPEIYIKKCEIGLLNDNMSSDELVITVAQVGRITQANITVTVE